MTKGDTPSRAPKKKQKQRKASIKIKFTMDNMQIATDNLVYI